MGVRGVASEFISTRKKNICNDDQYFSESVLVQFHKQYSQCKGFFDEIRKLFIGIALNYNLCKMQPECFATHIQYNFLLE